MEETKKQVEMGSVLKTNENKQQEAPSRSELLASYNNLLRREQDAMNQRIRDFVDAEHRRFEAVRASIAADRHAILSKLERRERVRSIEEEVVEEEEEEMRSVEMGLEKSVGGESAVDSALSSLSTSMGEPCSYATLNSPVKSSQQQQKMSIDENRGGGGPTAKRRLYSDEENTMFSFDEEATINWHDDIPKEVDEDDDENSTQDEQADWLEGRRPLGSRNDDWSRPPPTRLDSKRRGVPKGAGQLAYATSLPVAIPSQRYWPPREAYDSYDEHEAPPLQFPLPPPGPTKQDNEEAKAFLEVDTSRLAEEMRSLSRTIQAADDPERLFGERPRRRRYNSGTKFALCASQLQPAVF